MIFCLYACRLWRMAKGEWVSAHRVDLPLAATRTFAALLLLLRAPCAALLCAASGVPPLCVQQL